MALGEDNIKDDIKQDIKKDIKKDIPKDFLKRNFPKKKLENRFDFQGGTGWGGGASSPARSN